MKVIAIQSKRGGVGKTSLALNFANSAATDGKVCLIDFDFIGEGVFPHLRPKFVAKLSKLQGKEGSRFFLSPNPTEFNINPLLFKYDGFYLFLLRTQLNPPANRKSYNLWSNMHAMICNEQLYHEIQAKTQTLLEKLEKKGFTLVIFDCHTGDDFLVDAVNQLVQTVFLISGGRTIKTVKSKKNKRG